MLFNQAYLIIEHSHVRMETHQGNDHPIEGSSDRVFAWVMAGFFSIIGLWPLWSAAPLRSWALIIAGLFFILGLLWPSSLSGLNRLWMRFGLALSKITSPLAMGIVFYLAITPYAFVLRLFRKQLMPLRFSKQEASYWIKRDPAGPDPQDMKNMF
jgi:hypothetical protein